MIHCLKLAQCKAGTPEKRPLPQVSAMLYCECAAKGGHRLDFTPASAFVEKETATHSSSLAWTIPWTEEPGGLQSMGSQRVGHD